MANKSTLIEKVKVEAEVTNKQATKAVEAVFDGIREAMLAGESTGIVGFGTFDTRDRAERIGRNPQTGDEITIAAAKAPTFKASKKLKDLLNGKE